MTGQQKRCLESCLYRIGIELGKFALYVHCLCVLGGWGWGIEEVVSLAVFFCCITVVKLYFKLKLQVIKSQLRVGRQTNTHLCNVLNKVFAEGESAAYEPHSNHMVGQGHDVLVEPGGNGRNSSECAWSSENTRIGVWEYLLGGISVG